MASSKYDYMYLVPRGDYEELLELVRSQQVQQYDSMSARKEGVMENDRLISESSTAPTTGIPPSTGSSPASASSSVSVAPVVHTLPHGAPSYQGPPMPETGYTTRPPQVSFPSSSPPPSPSPPPPPPPPAPPAMSALPAPQASSVPIPPSARFPPYSQRTASLIRRIRQTQRQRQPLPTGYTSSRQQPISDEQVQPEPEPQPMEEEEYEAPPTQVQEPVKRVQPLSKTEMKKIQDDTMKQLITDRLRELEGISVTRSPSEIPSELQRHHEQAIQREVDRQRARELASQQQDDMSQQPRPSQVPLWLRRRHQEVMQREINRQAARKAANRLVRGTVGARVTFPSSDSPVPLPPATPAEHEVVYPSTEYALPAPPSAPPPPETTALVPRSQARQPRRRRTSRAQPYFQPTPELRAYLASLRTDQSQSTSTPAETQTPIPVPALPAPPPPPESTALVPASRTRPPRRYTQRAQPYYTSSPELHQYLASQRRAMLQSQPATAADVPGQLALPAPPPSPFLAPGPISQDQLAMPPPQSAFVPRARLSARRNIPRARPSPYTTGIPMSTTRQARVMREQQSLPVPAPVIEYPPSPIQQTALPPLTYVPSDVTTMPVRRGSMAGVKRRVTTESDVQGVREEPQEKRPRPLQQGTIAGVKRKLYDDYAASPPEKRQETDYPMW